VHDDRDALGLNALHNALNSGGTEVIRGGLHDETIDANHFRFALDDLVSNEVLARGVGVDDGMD
jgi:hypothetical protein